MSLWTFALTVPLAVRANIRHSGCAFSLSLRCLLAPWISLTRTAKLGTGLALLFSHKSFKLHHPLPEIGTELPPCPLHPGGEFWTLSTVLTHGCQPQRPALTNAQNPPSCPGSSSVEERTLSSLSPSGHSNLAGINPVLYLGYNQLFIPIFPNLQNLPTLSTFQPLYRQST